jgi:hypothetical protein
MVRTPESSDSAATIITVSAYALLFTLLSPCVLTLLPCASHTGQCGRFDVSAAAAAAQGEVRISHCGE